MSATEIQKSESDAAGDSSLGADAGTLTETSNIDKIRDILFGVQMRDYEKRFSRLEERLLKESSDLRDDTRKRFDALEAFVKSEVEALSERLLAEQRNRDESVQNLSRELQDTGKSLERKLGQFDEQTARTQPRVAPADSGSVEKSLRRDTAEGGRAFRAARPPGGRTRQRQDGPRGARRALLGGRAPAQQRIQNPRQRVNDCGLKKKQDVKKNSTLCALRLNFAPLRETAVHAGGAK